MSRYRTLYNVIHSELTTRVCGLCSCDHAISLHSLVKKAVSQEHVSLFMFFPSISSQREKKATAKTKTAPKAKAKEGNKLCNQCTKQSAQTHSKAKTKSETAPKEKVKECIKLSN